MAEFITEVRSDNQVKAELWYTSSDSKSLEFLKSSSSYLEPILKEGLLFEPKFVTWSCPYCDSEFKR